MSSLIGILMFVAPAPSPTVSIPEELQHHDDPILDVERAPASEEKKAGGK